MEIIKIDTLIAGCEACKHHEYKKLETKPAWNSYCNLVMIINGILVSDDKITDINYDYLTKLKKAKTQKYYKIPKWCPLPTFVEPDKLIFNEDICSICNKRIGFTQTRFILKINHKIVFCDKCEREKYSTNESVANWLYNKGYFNKEPYSK